MSSANEITAPGFAQSFVRVNDDCKLCYYANVEASKLSSTDGKPILLLLHGWPQSYVFLIRQAPFFPPSRCQRALQVLYVRKLPTKADLTNES